MSNSRTLSHVPLVRRDFAADTIAPFAGLVLLHGGMSVALWNMTGYQFDPGMAQLLAMILGILVPWFLLLLLIRRVLILALVERSERPIADLVSSVASLAANRARLTRGALNLLLVSFFIGSFGYQKELIAVLRPFDWDQAIADLSRFLFFGHYAFQYLLPIFGTPWSVTFFNAVYHAWLFVIYFATFCACFASPGHRASQVFLVALVLTFFIGGNLLATMFSSAGPVYFERLGYGGDFAPLMAHLRVSSEISPVWALEVQEDLWDSYLDGGMLAGISAMPSMHVASSVLLSLFAWTHSRWAGWAMTAFAAAIMIGSVLLGWHYAIDGLAGTAIAVGCWVLARRVA